MSSSRKSHVDWHEIETHWYRALLLLLMKTALITKSACLCAIKFSRNRTTASSYNTSNLIKHLYGYTECKDGWPEGAEKLFSITELKFCVHWVQRSTCWRGWSFAHESRCNSVMQCHNILLFLTIACYLSLTTRDWYAMKALKHTNRCTEELFEIETKPSLLHCKPTQSKVTNVLFTSFKIS